MNAWRVIVATMVIFAAGVLTGGLVVKFSERIRVPHPNRQNNPNRPPAPGNAGGSKLEFLKRAERELDLSTQQKDQIDKILIASQERTRKIMEPVSPRIREEIQRTREEFKTVLTDEQRKRFEDLLKQQRPRDPNRAARLLEGPSFHTNSGPSAAP